MGQRWMISGQLRRSQASRTPRTQSKFPPSECVPDAHAVHAAVGWHEVHAPVDALHCPAQVAGHAFAHSTDVWLTSTVPVSGVPRHVPCEHARQPTPDVHF